MSQRVSKSVSTSIKNNESGFSLVELMVVVSIIGILAAIAVPRFATFTARAQQTEAKSTLNGIFLSQQSYMANYQEFKAISGNPSAAGIGFELTGGKPRYNYHLASTQVGWAAVASSIAQINTETDVLRTNANKWTCAPHDAVTKVGATAYTGGKAAKSATECPQSGQITTASYNPTADAYN